MADTRQKRRLIEMIIAFISFIYHHHIIISSFIAFIERESESEGVKYGVSVRLWWTGPTDRSLSSPAPVMSDFSHSGDLIGMKELIMPEAPFTVALRTINTVEFFCKHQLILNGEIWERKWISRGREIWESNVIHQLPLVLDLWPVLNVLEASKWLLALTQSLPK